MQLSSSRINRKFQIRYLAMFATVIVTFFNHKIQQDVYSKKQMRLKDFKYEV